MLKKKNLAHFGPTWPILAQNFWDNFLKISDDIWLTHPFIIGPKWANVGQILFICLHSI